jgi:hypothetical protein
MTARPGQTTVAKSGSEQTVDPMELPFPVPGTFRAVVDWCAQEMLIKMFMERSPMKLKIAMLALAAAAFIATPALSAENDTPPQQNKASKKNTPNSTTNDTTGNMAKDKK